MPDVEKAREQLLERYSEIEKRLRAEPRKLCTFLSVDVVDYGEAKFATGELEVAASFQACEEMLGTIFDKYGAWKRVLWVGGATACFLDRECAVRAAQQILRSLKRFNKYDNKLPTPFRVCCGVNEDEVVMYPDTRLEKFQHLAKQLAICLAKQAHPDTLWVTAGVYERLAIKTGFKNLDTVIAGHRVYQWAPKAEV